MLSWDCPILHEFLIIYIVSLCPLVISASEYWYLLRNMQSEERTFHVLLQGLGKPTVGSRAGFPQAVHCTNYKHVSFYYVSLTSYFPYEVDYIYKIFISSSANSRTDRCCVFTVLYMYFGRHYLLIFN